MAPVDKMDSIDIDHFLEGRPLHNKAQTNSTPNHIASGDNLSEKETGCEEFMIAADLTLYANPLRCLTKKSTPTQNKAIEQTQVVAQAKETGDIIAADLTKYGSPLDDKN